MRVYVAGSSEQLDRAEAAMMAIEQRGHIVTHDWAAQIRSVGIANPPEASVYCRLKWSRECLEGVADADVVWLLMPLTGGFGAAVELGYAVARSIPIIVSGLAQRSIFTSFALKAFDRDDQALAFFKETP